MLITNVFIVRPIDNHIFSENKYTSYYRFHISWDTVYIRVKLIIIAISKKLFQINGSELFFRL